MRNRKYALQIISDIINARLARHLRHVIFLIAAILAGDPETVPAQSAAEFLRIGVGARAVAMGSAFVAIADDGSAPYWNPAGLANSPTMQATLSYVQLFGNLAQHQYLAASCRFNNSVALGAGWIHLGVDDLPRYGPLQGTRFDRLLDPRLRSTGQPGGFFSNREDAFILSMARAIDLEFSFGHGLASSSLPARLAVGVNMKFLRHALESARAVAQAVDLGVLLDLLGGDRVGAPRRQLSLGVHFQNLAAGGLAWNTPSKNREPIARRTFIGAAYRQAIPWLSGHFILSLADRREHRGGVALGGEYVLQNALFLRAGLDGARWSAGAGIALWHGRFDYAFIPHELGSSHRLSATVEF